MITTFWVEREVCGSTQYSPDSPSGTMKTPDITAPHSPERAPKYGAGIVCTALRSTFQYVYYTIMNLRLNNSTVVITKGSPYYRSQVKKAYRGNGYNTPRINFGTKWRWVVNFTLWPSRFSLGITSPVITG